MKAWQHEFFDRPLASILREYRELVLATLGDPHPYTEHIEKLHKLGYLPIEIWSIPEGMSVPIRVPMCVITNTRDSEFWLPNFLETIYSNILWKPCTSATTAQAHRRSFQKWAEEFGETDFSFINWQGHDFSFRGMSGREDAWLSGMGHLTSFSGTDTVPAIIKAREFYGAKLSCGGSVPATEHSVMCAGLEANEFDTFKRLITEIYPTGVVSIVSDTWDLWKVLVDYIPRLKEVILTRDGKVVIRPDSGDPVKIICGDPKAEGPAKAGVLRLLADALGTDGHGHINKAGAIYGDSITLERQDQILEQMVRELRLSPYNMVFGIGSFTYEYVTRDTYGFAMKATAVRRGDDLFAIFKKPKTDDGTKNSLKGIPIVRFNEETNQFEVKDGGTPSELENCDFSCIYRNGKLFLEEDWETICERVRR